MIFLYLALIISWPVSGIYVVWHWIDPRTYRDLLAVVSFGSIFGWIVVFISAVNKFFSLPFWERTFR